MDSIKPIRTRISAPPPPLKNTARSGKSSPNNTLNNHTTTLYTSLATLPNARIVAAGSQSASGQPTLSLGRAEPQPTTTTGSSKSEKTSVEWTCSIEPRMNLSSNSKSKNHTQQRIASNGGITDLSAPNGGFGVGVSAADHEHFRLLASTQSGAVLSLSVSENGFESVQEDSTKTVASKSKAVKVLREYRAPPLNASAVSSSSVGSTSGFRIGHGARFVDSMPGKFMETHHVARVAACPQEERLFAALEHVNLHVWDVERTEPLLSKRASADPVECVAWNNHAPHTLCLAGASGALKILDLRVLGGDALRPFFPGGGSTGLAAAKGIDVESISSPTAVSSPPPLPVMWKQNGAHVGYVRDVAWSPLVPHWLASTGDDAVVSIFDLRYTGRPVLRLEEHAAPVWRCNWAPTLADTIVTTGADGSMLVWSLGTGSPSKVVHSGSIPQSQHAIVANAFLPPSFPAGSRPSNAPFVDCISLAADGWASHLSLYDSFFARLLDREVELTTRRQLNCRAASSQFDIHTKSAADFFPPSVPLSLTDAHRRLQRMIYFRRLDEAVPTALHIAQQLTSAVSSSNGADASTTTALWQCAISVLDLCQPVPSAEPLAFAGVASPPSAAEQEPAVRLAHGPESDAVRAFNKDVHAYIDQLPAAVVERASGRLNQKLRQARGVADARTRVAERHGQRLRLRLETLLAVEKKDIPFLSRSISDISRLVRKYGPESISGSVDVRELLPAVNVKDLQGDNSHTKNCPISFAVISAPVVWQDLCFRLALCLRSTSGIGRAADAMYELVTALLNWFASNKASGSSASVSEVEWWAATVPACRIAFYPMLWDCLVPPRENDRFAGITNALKNASWISTSRQISSIAAEELSNLSVELLNSPSEAIRIAFDDRALVADNLKFVGILWRAAESNSSLIDVVRTSRAAMPVQSVKQGHARTVSILSIDALALYTSALWKSRRFDHAFSTLSLALASLVRLRPSKRSVPESDPKFISNLLALDDSPLPTAASAWFSTGLLDTSGLVGTSNLVSSSSGGLSLVHGQSLTASEALIGFLRGMCFDELKRFMQSVLDDTISESIAEVPSADARDATITCRSDKNSQRRKAVIVCVRLLALASSSGAGSATEEASEIIPTNVAAFVSASLNSLTSTIEESLVESSTRRFVGEHSSIEQGTRTASKEAEALLDRISQAMSDPDLVTGESSMPTTSTRSTTRVPLRKNWQRQLDDLENRLRKIAAVPASSRRGRT